VALAVGWWVFRRTLSLVRKLLMLALATMVTMGVVGVALTLFLAR
jgi:hypothetical protein